MEYVDTGVSHCSMYQNEVLDLNKIHYLTRNPDLMHDCIEKSVEDLVEWQSKLESNIHELFNDFRQSNSADSQQKRRLENLIFVQYQVAKILTAVVNYRTTYSHRDLIKLLNPRFHVCKHDYPSKKRMKVF
jgi:regulator of replication initiation timing